MGDKCWLKASLEEGECPNIDPEGEAFLLHDQKARMRAKCLECPKLMMDLMSCEAPHKMAMELLPRVLEDDQSRAQSLRERLERDQRRLKALSEVAALIRDSTDLDEIIHTILTYLTAGDGLGYNRAWFLLEEGGFLRGYWAIGPKDPQEAMEIWRCVNSEGCSVHDLLERKGTLYRDRERLWPLLEKLVFPLDDREPMVRLLNIRKAFVVERGSCPELASLLDLLKVRELLVLPLWSGENLLGCILVDNVVSAEPFNPVDVKAMDTFAVQAALAVERAGLYRQLERKVRELERCSEEMKCQYDSLAKLEKMKVVSNITSRMAHELRNPLTAIGGLARYLLKTGKSDEKIFKAIVKEASRLEDLIRDLVSYADSICPSKTLLDLGTVVKKSLEEVEEILGDGKHVLQLFLEKGPLMVLVDPKHIRILLWNLLKNSMEAMPHGGEIKVSLRREGEEALLMVEDRGEGIPQEILNKVTMPFFSTKGGTGMGLSICKNIIDGYGGRLEIEPLREGTLVKVWLPLFKEEDLQKPEGAFRGEKGGKDETSGSESHGQEDGTAAWEKAEGPAHQGNPGEGGQYSLFRHIQGRDMR